MRIDVHTYAALREAVGVSSVVVDVSEDAVVSDVLDRLVELHPQAAPYRTVMRAAISDRYVPSNTRVTESVEIHIITPVSGG